MRELSGKRVLITGAARGIGRALAARFAEAGADVLLVDVDAAALEETAEALRAMGPEVRAFQVDLTRPEEIRRLAGRVRSEVGTLDALVNNAGVVSGGPYLTVSDAGDERMLNVNAAAVHWVTKAFLPLLLAAPEAHVVMMASAAGLVGVPYQAVYSATKWFVVGLAEALRQELVSEGHRHVAVTVVCPSLVDTGMFAGARAPRWTPWIPADAMAEFVLRAVRRNRPYVRVPFMVKTVPVLRALLPTSVTDALGRRLGLNRVMSTFAGHAAGSGDGRATAAETRAGRR